MKNGEKVKPNWLVYSTTKDCVYCFCCKLFGSVLSSLSIRGSKDWKHLPETLNQHETSKEHIQSQKSWIELSLRMQYSKMIDSHSQRLITAEINHWYEVLLRIAATIKMLAQNCLTLRGTSDKLYDFGNGNFLQIVQLLAQFYPVMEEHLRKVIKKEEVKVHYLGEEIQNELITLLGKNITFHIIGENKKAKYYSVIIDCTPDISKTEQMTVLVRYVSIDKSNPKEVSIKINESFLGFLLVERSIGYELSTLILKTLETLGLNLQDMRGQAFDNGANMRRNKSGVQSRINALNPRAFYLPCSSHSLNLVVNDMAKASFEAANFFNIVQKIHLFFFSSTFRWTILLKYVHGLTLKPLSDTRWESQTEALKPLRYQLGGIYDALLAISHNSEIDNSLRVEASGLLSCVKQFKFLCCIVIWYKILNCINPISKLLQTKDYDLQSAMELLKNCKDFFMDLRSDTAFNEMFCDARELADEIDIPANFELTQPRHRVRRRNVNFDYEARDDPIEDPTLKYKAEFYFFTLERDKAINALEFRFDLINTHSSYFQFLYNICDLKDTPQNDVLKYCNDLEIVLTDGNS
ncbi:zinc finger MYM-type protein 1 [Trichonephila clavipes]|nr:zinc finger MYM-type protein 1 [Trichonephila clavipes]